MRVETHARNAQLSELIPLLQEQRDVRYDVVINAAALRSVNGDIEITDGAAVVTDDGVSSAPAVLRPTEVFDDGVSQRLNIPRDYLRRLRARGDHGELLDENVNGWLHDDPERRFLVRGFRTDDANESGIARALLSDRFRPVDNLDVLIAVLDGVNRSGVECEVQGGDITERRMRVRISAPAVSALAPTLLANYRSPFAGVGQVLVDPQPLPVVFAGFEVRNSETGGSAFSIVPRITVQICSNGMTITKDAFRQVHLGGKLDEGVVQWSNETQQANLELVTNQARDAVSTFLDQDYLQAKIDEVEAVSATPVEDIVPTIERVATQFKFTDTEQQSILDAFTRSGDITAGGVMQAVTAAAQSIDDGDRAAELEDAALDVLAFAAH